MRRGTPAVLVGGTEAPLSPLRAGLPDRPAAGCPHADRGPSGYKPFDAAADGYVPGEGGAILLLEDAGAARGARGARRSRARSPATRATHDAHHHEDPAADAGQYARRCGARWPTPACTPDEVDVVFADGAGVAGAGRARGSRRSGRCSATGHRRCR